MSNALTTQQPPTKQVVPIGNRGIAPSSMDDLYRFATAVSKSGLAPKGIETPEAIFVALEMGLEVGLPMMAALQNIAVINGRPAIWGDAQLAVVRSTGELALFEEWYEEKGKRLTRNPMAFSDETAAVCRVQRQGYEPAETAFSVADAKRANLWGKAGPWTQYPARMLKHRARSFALRDQFGDALRGLRTVEEVQDDPVATARNVTPPMFATPTPEPEVAPEPAPVAEATQETAQPSDLDMRRQAIAEAFIEVGVSFDLFRTWMVEVRKIDVAADSFAELDEALVGRIADNLGSVVSKAKKWVEGGGK
jgi:hypothetical protein